MATSQLFAAYVMHCRIYSIVSYRITLIFKPVDYGTAGMGWVAIRPLLTCTDRTCGSCFMRPFLDIVRTVPWRKFGNIWHSIDFSHDCIINVVKERAELVASY